MTEYGFPVFTLCSVVLDLLPLTQDVSGTQGVYFFAFAYPTTILLLFRFLTLLVVVALRSVNLLE